MKRALVVLFFCLTAGALLLWAASETLAPDAILAQSGFTPSCAVADIDDDPDSGDTNWCVATDDNTSVDVRVSFPSPSGNPTVGADLQEFRWQVRRTAGSGTGTPTTRAELWENGALVRAGSNENVTSDSGEVHSFTWNANELGTADGSLVEVNIIGTKTGGSPTVRASIDVGAVEWNVEYTEAGGKLFIITVSE